MFTLCLQFLKCAFIMKMNGSNRNVDDRNERVTWEAWNSIKFNPRSLLFTHRSTTHHQFTHLHMCIYLLRLVYPCLNYCVNKIHYVYVIHFASSKLFTVALFKSVHFLRWNWNFPNTVWNLVLIEMVHQNKCCSL